MPVEFDVAVIGLGGAGSAIAFHLARRGVRVIGLDQAGLVNTAGASHGGSRIVRRAYAEGDDFMPLLRRAHTLWDELGEEAGGPVLRRCGVLFAGRAGSAVVADTLASADRHGLALERLDAAGLRARSPMLVWPEDAEGCFDAGAGVVVPEQVVALHLALARRHGAVLRGEAGLRGWRPDGAGVAIDTAEGPVRAGHLVVCAGAWAPRIMPGVLHGAIAVQRQVQHWFAVPPAHRPALDPARCPVHVWDDGGLFYAMPMLDGPAGGLKCCLEDDSPPEDVDAITPDVAAADIAAAAAQLRRRAPWAGAWLRGAVCHYAATADNRFLLGPAPGHRAVTLACGLGGHGFKFTPAIGEAVADAVLGTGDPAFLRPFSPARLLVPA